MLIWTTRADIWSLIFLRFSESIHISASFFRNSDWDYIFPYLTWSADMESNHGNWKIRFKLCTRCISYFSTKSVSRQSHQFAVICGILAGMLYKLPSHQGRKMWNHYIRLRINITVFNSNVYSCRPATILPSALISTFSWQLRERLKRKRDDRIHFSRPSQAACK